MNFEISRVYRDIIEEVTRGLLAECDELKMTPKQIAELKMSWGLKLREMTMMDNGYNFRVIQQNEVISPFNNKKEKNENEGSENSSLSDSDDDEKLEAAYPNYMMCLYDKVDKSKDRWRVKMKQGFLNVGKSEFAFDTAHGSLYW
ncbi:transcription factor IIA subunit alpha [Gurleya vavrai]